MTIRCNDFKTILVRPPSDSWKWFQNLVRVLSANSPTGCSADKQPVTGHGLRARRGAPFAATRLGFETSSSVPLRFRSAYQALFGTKRDERICTGGAPRRPHARQGCRQREHQRHHDGGGRIEPAAASPPASSRLPWGGATGARRGIAVLRRPSRVEIRAPRPALRRPRRLGSCGRRPTIVAARLSAL